MAQIPGEQTAEQRAATYGAAGVADPANSLEADKTRASNQGKAGYDVLGNPIPNYTAPTPGSVPSPSEYYSRIGPEPKATVAESAETIQARKEASARALIDSVNAQYDSELKDQLVVNQGRERGTNAISALTGLSGSTEANVASEKTDKLNKTENDRINNQRAVAIQSILYKISDAAVQEAKQSRDEARQSAQDVMAYREKAASDAVSHLTQLAQSSGATLEGLKATLKPEEYDYLVKNAGGEAAVKSLLVLNRPKEAIIDKKIENGKYVIAYQDPMTGKVRIESTDLGVPDHYTKSFDLGDKLMIVPDNFDPKKDTPIYVSKGAVPKTVAETQKDKETNVVTQYSNAFTLNSDKTPKRLSDGTPTINTKNGTATYNAWQSAITEAPTKGMTRQNFIKTFGYLTVGKDGSIDDEYGLTPVEKRLILGPQKEEDANPFEQNG